MADNHHHRHQHTTTSDKMPEHREDGACCEEFPIEPILLDQDTLLPIFNGGNAAEDGEATRTRGPRSSKRRPPQIILRALHEDVLRPLRQFFLGSLYCPSEFGLTGGADDPGEFAQQSFSQQKTNCFCFCVEVGRRPW